MTFSSRAATRFVLIFALVGVSVFALMYSRSAPAAPTVTWTPASLSAEVAAGQSSTTSATFTASENAKNATVWVVPEIAPYVKVAPSSFASLTKGASYTVQVTFAPPATAATGTYDGTIHLRQGAKTLAKPLPSQLRVVWPTFGGSEVLGITVAYPPGWYITEKKSSLLIRNVEVSSSSIEDQLYNESFFKVARGRNVNPNILPIADWFSQLSAGAEKPVSIQSTQIDGHDALFTVISEFGGNRAHMYVAINKDVLEVSYPLFAPRFMADYEAMVKSISFTE